jgi:hypothetical protein
MSTASERAKDTMARLKGNLFFQAALKQQQKDKKQRKDKKQALGQAREQQEQAQPQTQTLTLAQTLMQDYAQKQQVLEQAREQKQQQGRVQTLAEKLGLAPQKREEEQLDASIAEDKSALSVDDTYVFVGHGPGVCAMLAAPIDVQYADKDIDDDLAALVADVEYTEQSCLMRTLFGDK